MGEQEFMVLCIFLLLCFFHGYPFCLLWRLVSLLVIEKSFSCFIHASLWFHVLHLFYFMFAFGRVFQYWQNLEGHLFIRHTMHYFLILCPPLVLWHVRWSTFFLTNNIGNGATIKQNNRPRWFQWMCVCCNCHSSYSAPLFTANYFVDMGNE